MKEGHHFIHRKLSYYSKLEHLLQNKADYLKQEVLKEQGQLLIPCTDGNLLRILSGEPGYGKTALLNYLKEENRVIHLPDIRVGELGQILLQQGNLLILDALDEVDSISKIMRDIINLFSLNNNQLTVVVSCRKGHLKDISDDLSVIEYSDKLVVEYYDLIPLNGEEIKSILNEYIYDKKSLDSIISKFHLTQPYLSYKQSEVLPAPRYAHYVGELLKQGIIQPENLPCLYDILNLIVDYSLETEVKKDGYQKWAQMIPIIRNLQSKLALVMKINNKGSLTKNELAHFFDRIDSNFAHSFVSTESLKFFIERSLLKETDGGKKVEFDNKDLFDFLAAWELNNLERPDQTLIEVSTKADMKILLPHWYEMISLLVEKNPPLLPDLLRYLLSADNQVQFNEFITRALYRIDFSTWEESIQDHVFSILSQFYLTPPFTRYNHDSSIGGVLRKIYTQANKCVFAKWFHSDNENEFWLAIEILEAASYSGSITPQDWLISYQENCLNKLKDHLWVSNRLQMNKILLRICFNQKWRDKNINRRELKKTVKSLDVFIVENTPEKEKRNLFPFWIDLLQYRQSLWNILGEQTAVFHFRTLLKEYAFDQVENSTRVDIATYQPLSSNRNDHLVLQFIQLFGSDETFFSLCEENDLLRFVFPAIGQTQSLDDVFHERLAEAINQFVISCLQTREDTLFYDLDEQLRKLPSKHYISLFKNWTLNLTMRSRYRGLVINNLISRLTFEDRAIILSIIEELPNDEEKFPFMFRVIRHIEAIKEEFLINYSGFESYLLDQLEQEEQNRIEIEKLNNQEPTYITEQRERLPHLGEAINIWIDNPSKQTTHNLIKWAYATKDVAWETNQEMVIFQSVNHLFNEVKNGNIPCQDCIINALSIAFKKEFPLSEHREVLALHEPFLNSPHLFMGLDNSPKQLLKDMKFQPNEMSLVYQKLIEENHLYLKNTDYLQFIITYLYYHPDRVALPILESALWNPSISPIARREALESIDKICGVKKERYLQLLNDSYFCTDKYNQRHLDYQLAKMGEGKDAIIQIVDEALKFVPPPRLSNSIYAKTEIEDLSGDFLSTIIHPNYREEFFLLLEGSLKLCGSDNEEKRNWGSTLLNYAEHYFSSNLQKTDSVLWSMLEDINKKISSETYHKPKGRLTPKEILGNIFARLAVTYAVALSERTILNSVHHYNELSKKRFLPVRSVEDLQSMLIRIIENDLQKWITEEGAYDLLYKVTKIREELFQKSIKSHFELCMTRHGLRPDDLNLYREVQGLNDKKPDYVINYGIIGSVMIEIKMADNEEVAIYKTGKNKGDLKNKAKEYVSTLKNYLSISRSSVGIFLIVDQGNRKNEEEKHKRLLQESEINTIKDYYKKELPSIRVCYLRCFE